MKKIVLFLLVAIPFISIGQRFTPIQGYGIEGRIKLLGDTVTNKQNGSIAVLNDTFYIKASIGWVKVSGSGSGGLDTTQGDLRYVRIQRFLDSIASVRNLANTKITEAQGDLRYTQINRFLDSLLAVRTSIDTKQNNLGFTPENVANKVNTLTSSTTEYPTTKAVKDVTDLLATTSSVNTALAGKENTITAPNTSLRYWNGYKQFVPLNKDSVGLSNVDNTSDLNKPISTATQTVLNNKADKATTITVGSGTAAQDLSTNRTFLSNVPNVDATQRANHTGTQTASTISDFTTAARSSISATAPLVYSSGVLSLDSNRWVGKNRNNDTIQGNKVYREPQTIFASTPISRLRNTQDSNYAEFYRENGFNKSAFRNQARQNGGAGNAITFPNSSHQGQFPTTGFPFGNNMSFTITGWFFPFDTNPFTLVYFGSGSVGANSSFNVAKNGNSLNVNVGSATNNIAAAGILTNQWSFFSVSYNGATGVITTFCNGIVAISTDQRANINLAFTSIGRIARRDDEVNPFNGRIDQMCFFNKVLSRNGVNGELDKIYNNGVGTSLNSDFPSDGSLTRRWDFEDGSGTTAVETSGVSGGPYNMTFPNGVSWVGIGSGKVSTLGSTVLLDFVQNVDAIGTSEQPNTIIGTPIGRTTTRGVAFDFLTQSGNRPFIVRSNGRMLLNSNNSFTEPTINNNFDLVGNMSIGTPVAAPIDGLRVSGNTVLSNVNTGSTTTVTAQLNLGASTATSNTGQIFFADGVGQITPQNGVVNRVGNNIQFTTSSTVFTFAKTLTNTATLDFPSTGSNGTSDLTVTLTGAADGDVVSIGVPSASSTVGIFYAFVSSTNTITIRFHNNSGGSVDPASGTFRVSIIKY